MVKVISYIDNARYEVSVYDANYEQIRNKRCIEQCDIAYHDLVSRNKLSISHNFIGFFYQTFFNEVYLIIPKNNLTESLHRMDKESVSHIDIEEIGRSVDLPL